MTTEVPQNPPENKKPNTIPVEGDLLLRRIVPEDSEAIFALIDQNRKHLSQFDDHTAEKYPTLESVRKKNSTQSPDERRFGIWDKGEFVGFVKVTERRKDDWEIGYWLGRGQTGKGYMTKAVAALTRYVAEHLGARRVFGEVHRGNKASMAVLERAGYHSAGINPENPDEVIFESIPGAK